MAFTLRPVKGADFINRGALLKEMEQTLVGKGTLQGYALYGRRRIGKTSIFKEVQRRLKAEKQTISVYFSLWDLVEGTVGEFSQQLTAETLEAFRPKLKLKHKAKTLLQASGELLRDILKGLNINVKLQEDIELLLGFDRAKPASTAQLIERVFQLAEGLARETRTKCIVFLDEFPALLDMKPGGNNNAKLGEGIIRKIRTLQEDFEHTVLCVSGSYRKTMETAVLNSGSAFYGQFILKEIGPFGKNDVKRLMVRNLPVPLSADALDVLHEFTQGIPFYVQFLGRALLAEGHERIEAAQVEAAARHFLEEEGHLLFREQFSKLSSKQRRFAVTMARKRLSSPSALAKHTGESLNIVSRYLQYLETHGVVQRVSRGVYRFEDPVFARWLAQR